MASSLIPLLSQGPRPVEPPDPFKIAQDAAAAKNAQAQVGLTQAQTQQAQASAALTRTDAALKQRDIDAQKVAAQSFQKNAYKNPDGSVSVDYPSIYAELSAAGFSDKAAALRSANASAEDAEVQKNTHKLDLAKAQNGLVALALGNAGIVPGAKLDPQAAVKAYAAASQWAQANGVGDKMPFTPQQFTQNPTAATEQAQNIVGASGQTAAALEQKKAQVLAQQAIVGQARTFASSVFAGITDPAQVPAAKAKIMEAFPDQYSAIGIGPDPKTPQELKALQDGLNVAAAAPDVRQALVTQARTQVSEAELRKQQGIEALAGAGQRTAEAGLARAQTQQVQAQTVSAYGNVDNKGNPVPPPAGTAGTTGDPLSPTISRPGNAAPIDLSKDPNWFRQPVGARKVALNLLSTGDPGAAPDKGTEQNGYTLARALDPQWKEHAEARQTIFKNAQDYIPVANAMIQHGGDLLDLAKQLNAQYPGALNKSIADIKAGVFGSVAQASFNDLLDKYQDEVGKVAQGSQALHVGTKEDQNKVIDTKKTLGQLFGIVATNNEWMNKKADAINHQFNVQNGGQMFGGSGLQVLYPETKQLMASQAQRSSAQAGKVRVQIPGSPVGEISASKLEQFKKDHPNAVIFK